MFIKFKLYNDQDHIHVYLSSTLKKACLSCILKFVDMLVLFWFWRHSISITYRILNQRNWPFQAEGYQAVVSPFYIKENETSITDCATTCCSYNLCNPKMPAADTSITFTVSPWKIYPPTTGVLQNPVFLQSDETGSFAVFGSRANVGDLKNMVWLVCFREHAIRRCSPQVCEGFLNEKKLQKCTLFQHEWKKGSGQRFLRDIKAFSFKG